MKIYFAINECEDLGYHFDLKGIYLSKDDLFEDLSAIKKDGSSVYSCEDSMFINPKINRGSLHQENNAKCDDYECEIDIDEVQEYIIKFSLRLFI